MERTDKLAERMGVSLRQLSGILGISNASLFGCRNGKIPVSNKTWSKLEHVERRCSKNEAEKQESQRHSTKSSTTAKQSDVGDPAYVVSEEVPAYRAEVDAIASAFAKIREGLDMLEQVMKELGK